MSRSKLVAFALVAAAITISGCNQTQSSQTNSNQSGHDGSAITTSKNAKLVPMPKVESIDGRVLGQPRGQSDNAMRFSSATTGYMVGNGLILKTTDGGLHFQTVAHPGMELTQLSVSTVTPTSIAAWGGHTTLISHNSGSSWSAFTFPTRIHQVEFSTPSIGFAITDGAGTESGNSDRLLWQTTDGGVKWNQLRSPGSPMSISFGSPNIGWMSTASGSILETVDAGQAWSKVEQIPTLSGYAPPSSISLHAASAHVCWALVANSGQMSQGSYSVFRTTNGTNWIPVLAKATAGDGPAPGEPGRVPVGPGSAPGPMAVVQGTDAAVVAGQCEACSLSSSESISETSNAGANWSNEPWIPNGMGAPSSMSFVSLSEGWLLDSGADVGVLLQTLNGGRSWREVYPTTHPHPVNGVSLVNDHLGYGVGIPGDARALLRTNDGGRSWYTIGVVPKVGANQTVQIAFLTQQRGFLAYDMPAENQSKVYQTTDEGEHWTLVRRLAGNGVSLTFEGTQDGAACSSTSLWLTTDGGKSWHAVDQAALSRSVVPPSDPAIAGLYLAQTAHLRIATSLAKLVQSQSNTIPTQLSFAGSRVAWFPDQNGFLLVTDSGTKARLINGFANTDNTGVAPELIGENIDFINAQDGWTWSGSSLLRTTNGGLTWTYASHPES